MPNLSMVVWLDILQDIGGTAAIDSSTTATKPQIRAILAWCTCSGFDQNHCHWSITPQGTLAKLRLK